jgi:F-type H+-transporting ATPase subunit delta
MSTRAAYRYAKALLDLALEQKQEEAVNRDMALITQSLQESKDLKALLLNPTYQAVHKKNILDEIFGQKIHHLSIRLFSVLADNNRMELLPAVAEAYTNLYNEAKGIIKATVTTALPIQDDLKEKIIRKAGKIARGKEIILENKIDPSIIGGYILRIGDVQINADINGKLEELKRELIQNN